MADCPKLPACPFFNDQMGGMPALADMIKERFCTGDHRECARFQVSDALGKTAVPKDLFPRHTDRARQIIKLAKKRLAS